MMNVTKDIINDLLPLYAANECSGDTRALVEEYLQQNPRQAEELRRIMNTPLPGAVPPAKNLAETHSFREARRRLGRRNWLMAPAIFFSLAPFSFLYTEGRLWWFLRDAPWSALVYAAIGVVFWILYLVQRHRSQSL
jgi:ferric-dicitrate binding protein FerR (iron transport regulator)